jgi:hypothetical protein
MSDVFVSYSSLDRSRVSQFVNALESYGLNVWWDQHLDAGSRWSDEIETRLRSAKCVVVLWSKNSVTSEWVVKEAGIGQDRGILVPVRLDDCEFPFSEHQAADLRSWNGQRYDPGLQRLISSIQRMLPAIGAIMTPEERAAILEDRRNRAYKIFDITIRGEPVSVFVSEKADDDAIETARQVSNFNKIRDNRDYIEFVLASRLDHYPSVHEAINDQNQAYPNRAASSVGEYLQAVTDRAVASYRQQYLQR